MEPQKERIRTFPPHGPLSAPSLRGQPYPPGKQLQFSPQNNIYDDKSAPKSSQTNTKNTPYSQPISTPQPT